MRNISCIFAICIGLACSTAFEGYAQKEAARITGRVIQVETSAPLDFAAITLHPSNAITTSDADGKFAFDKVSPGEITLSAQFFGMEKVDTTFTVLSGATINLELKMRESNFWLENVVVTATRNDAGKSTASNISRQAMDHMQTSSLSDIAALLPGGATANPSLSRAQNFTIRSLSGTSSNSLGTAIMVDGAPISNNANLQTLAPSVSGSTASPFDSESTISGGIDVRNISTDNIESIEIIRGIPSAQYGDVTSGAVMIKSKAGRSPLTVRFKTNPNIYQASVSKGFSLGRKAGDLNVSGDYAYNKNKLTADYMNYQRANAKVLYSKTFGNGNISNTSLNLVFAKDTENPDKDRSGGQEYSYEKELGLQFNTNGRININRYWLKAVNYLVSGSYMNKDSYVHGRAENAMNLYSTCMENGLVYSNTVGEKIFDSVTGNELTNLGSEENLRGRILPYSYLYQFNIYGKEINAFGKVNVEMGHTWGNVTDRLLAGVDYKTDGNLGAGSVYEDAAPPWRSIGNSDSGYRRRPFYSIPFVNQAGGYIEDSFVWQFAGREFNLTAGARYDYVWSGDMRMSAVSPRINASIDIFPWMTLRGGWGIAAKAPTTLYLNPNYAYHDAILYNGCYTNRDEADHLLIARTDIYETKNHDLQMAKNNKSEIGLDFLFAKKYSVSITGYYEYMGNGYSLGHNLDSWKYYHVTPITEVSYTPGSKPVVRSGDVTYDYFFETFTPMNSAVMEEKGVEYEIDLGRFNAIRTSFYINGAWMRSSTTSNNYTYTKREPANTHVCNIAVYNPFLSTSFYERLNTSLRITHNIPDIGFAITLTGYLEWFTKTWNEYKGEDIFDKYISHKDGKVHDFDPALKDDPEFSYMLGGITPNYIAEHTPSFATFNLNLSKEVNNWLTASFYVNNLLNTRPLYRYNETGTITELATPIYFGFELKAKIR